MNVLGIKFERTMKWREQVSKAVKELNTNLYGIKIIKKYFSVEEVKNLRKAVYYTKLYNGAEIWHIPGLSLALNKSIKFASANARRTCLPGMSIMNTHTEIHNMAQRALPANVCMCKYAIMFYKLIQNIICEDEFLYLNFQLLDNERVTKFKFVKQQSFDVGKNILLNRMYDTIDNKIDKKWLQLGLDSYKIECKDLFLKLMMLSLGGPTK